MNDKESTILLNRSLLSIIDEHDLFKEILPFDQYHLNMSQTDLLSGNYSSYAVKTYFYRIPPFGSSYTVTAGIISLINKINTFSYKTIVPYLERSNFHPEFINYAKTRDKLQVEVLAIDENSIAFPNEPILITRSNLIDSRLIEGLILSELNFASLVTTKWHRIKMVAKSAPISDFGRRRAQNALKSSLYSYYSRVNSTSNCDANYYFGIPLSGTMGHEFIQSYNSELEAFNDYLKYNVTTPILLIDTINTLESGVDNAIKAFKQAKQSLDKHGCWNKIGVRIDSGDLAYLSSVSYNKLSVALESKDINIILSNDLDEYKIESIINQLRSAGNNNLLEHIFFGVGTRAATAWDSPALGGVCKLSEFNNNYIIKISNNNIKTTIPGECRSVILTEPTGEYLTTLIYLKDEDLDSIDTCVHPNDSTKTMKIRAANFREKTSRQKIRYSSLDEKKIFIDPSVQVSLNDIQTNQLDVLNTLDWTYKRIFNPHVAKVSLSPKLFKLREYMIKNSLIKLDKNIDINS